MATYSALLQDFGGQTADMLFGADSSPAKIETFLTAHSSAGLTGVNKLTEQTVNVTSAEADSDVQRKALVYGRKVSDHSQVKFSIPAPKGFSTEQTEKGERIVAADGQIICDSWAVMMGLTAGAITFVEGIIIEAE